MNVVDSSAWLEYFADGPNAGFFAPAIEATDDLIVPSICVLEYSNGCVSSVVKARRCRLSH